jgi:hypothetical protein
METEALRLADALRQFRDSVAQRRPDVSRTLQGIDGLLAAMQDEFALDTVDGRSLKRAGDHPEDRSRLKRQVRAQQRQVQALRHEYDANLGAKVQGRLRYMWFIRAGLSNPAVPTRTLSEFFRDFGIEEASQMSATRMASARNAFCEIVKKMYRRDFEQRCETLGPGGSIVMTHVHDEALMRVRSFVESLNSRLNRGRYSKVLNHVVWLQLDDDRLDWPVELQPLAKKDAPSVATGLLKVLQTVFECVQERARTFPANKRVRLLHILVGDAIGTNEAAAKRMLHHMQQVSRDSNVTYCLAVVKCGSHQSNLVVKVAVCGGLIPKPEDNCPIAGACIRLYKYLLPAYDEEFSASLMSYICRSLNFRKREDVEPDQQVKSQRMAALYGEDVLPPSVLRLLNCGVGVLAHASQDEVDRTNVQQAVHHAIVKHFLFLEERPVVCRFWLFARCVYCLLGMQLLGLDAKEMFKLTRTTPQEANSKRLTRFLTFMTSPEASRTLRRASLCLQLTQYALNITAKKHTNQQGRLPSLILLSQGEVQTKTALHFKRLVPLLAHDPGVDVGFTLSGLLVTLGHIFIRFVMYCSYPYELWRLSEKYNSAGHAHITEIEKFLSLDEKNLDVGFSLILQQEALRSETHADQITYLLSPPVQQDINHFFECGEASSLDVERKHAQDKRHETLKVSSASTVSRNSILQLYRRRRTATIVKNIVTKRASAKNKHMNIRALAIQERPDLFGRARGRLRWEKGISEHAAQQMVTLGDEPALRQYIEEHRSRLEETCREIRGKAKELCRQQPTFPLSNKEWLEWLENNADEFEEALRKSSSIRKQHAVRVTPLAPHMPALARLQPSSPTKVFSDLEARVKASGAGFFCVQAIGIGDPWVFFACPLCAEVWGIQLTCSSHREYSIDFEADLLTIYRPLSEHLLGLGVSSSEMISEVTRLEVSFVQLSDAVATWHVEKAFAAKLPEKQKPTRPEAEEKSESDLESDFSGSDVQSVFSEVETRAEETAEEGGKDDSATSDQELENELALPRAPRGSYTVLWNFYFTLTNNPNYPNCVMSIRSRWQKDEELGSTVLSRVLVIKHFDTDDANPLRTYLALRSWMLWRFQQNGFAEKSKPRREWLAQQEFELRRDISKLRIPGGGTGHGKADRLIRGWTPGVLS